MKFLWCLFSVSFLSTLSQFLVFSLVFLCFNLDPFLAIKGKSVFLKLTSFCFSFLKPEFKDFTIFLKKKKILFFLFFWQYLFKKYPFFFSFFNYLKCCKNVYSLMKSVYAVTNILVSIVQSAYCVLLQCKFSSIAVVL